ncbi:MAG: dipeptidase [Alphaproteobacteria bacterium]|nr:dipeptidase [Alphaproteobacteria bacterium]MDX5415018.1 dipeptidase [Alphaproteobacteria bacterium]MDX5492203.1 dipeptidase [Alphaproteobacteria bacterium]
MKRFLIGLAVFLALAVILALALLPGFVEDRINRVTAHEPYDISAETGALHQRLVIADLHADTLLWARDPLKRASRGHVDLPRLDEGNVALQVFTAVTKVPSGQNYESNEAGSDVLPWLLIAQRWPARTWDSLLERALYQAWKLEDAERRAPETLRIIRSRADLDTLLAAREKGSRRIGGLLGIEGSHPLEGNLANVARLHAAGYRLMGLHHFFDNELGGSFHGITGAGLSDFGKEALREMERLGITIDVAHSSPAVVEDVLAIATKPIVLSHTGLRGACDSPRNIEDDLAKRIAEQGGVIGIGYWPGAVCDSSPANIVRTIRYAIGLLGVDHVGLGSDYDGAVRTDFDTSEIAVLTEEMRKANFTEEEIFKVMGGNVIRVFRENLPAG